jgi:hypothetical protein
MGKFPRRWLMALLLATAGAAFAANDRCDVCRRLLPEKHWIYEGRACCSETCIKRIRPRCSGCRKVIEGRYYESMGEIFCSNECFEETLPHCEICEKPIHSGFSITYHDYCDDCMKKAPICFSCGLPAALPTRLDDGREVCNPCMRWAVKTQETADKHYAKAVKQIETWTSLKLESVPTLMLVDRGRMHEMSENIRKSDSPVPIRGLYSRQTFLRKRGIFGTWRESPEDSKETIYIIDHLHDEVFRAAAVHELMHDLIHEHYPRLKDAPLWVHEGICQMAAAEYCRRRHYIDVLQGIETCTDPDYGDGYKYFHKNMGFEGWSALREWMETVDVSTLPALAPKAED